MPVRPRGPPGPAPTLEGRPAVWSALCPAPGILGVGVPSRPGRPGPSVSAAAHASLPPAGAVRVRADGRGRGGECHSQGASPVSAAAPPARGPVDVSSVHLPSLRARKSRSHYRLAVSLCISVPSSNDRGVWTRPLGRQSLVVTVGNNLIVLRAPPTSSVCESQGHRVWLPRP